MLTHRSVEKTRIGSGPFRSVFVVNFLHVFCSMFFEPKKVLDACSWPVFAPPVTLLVSACKCSEE